MRLSDQDASFLYMESASAPMHGGGISVVEGEVDFADFARHVEARLGRLPRYRQKLAYVPFNMAHPKWVDDGGFDITEHVLHHALPEGSTIEDALACCTELAEPLLPRDKPLWRIYLISGVPDRTILLQLAHHAMIDGASGVDVSLELFDLQQQPKSEPEPPPAWTPAREPSSLELISEAMMDAASRVQSQGAGLMNAVREMSGRSEIMRRAAESMTRFVSEPVVTAPWNAGMVGPKRVFDYRCYPFGEIREIRRAFGGTINDVVLAITIEAAARYLDDHGESAGDRHLRVMCPVNVRREDEHGAMGNRVSGIFPMFDAGRMEMVDRLRGVRWETEQIKQNREAQAMELLMESMPSIPPIAMAPTLLVGSRLDPTLLGARFPFPVPPPFGPRPPMVGFNFTCTNVPGVQTSQYLLGHEVLDQMAMLMLGGNLGYGVAILSYNQRLYFNFISDPRLLPDLDVMAAHADQAFAELLAAARAQTTEQA